MAGSIFCCIASLFASAEPAGGLVPEVYSVLIIASLRLIVVRLALLSHIQTERNASCDAGAESTCVVAFYIVDFFGPQQKSEDSLPIQNEITFEVSLPSPIQPP